jgi:hypothetical protein
MIEQQGDAWKLIHAGGDALCITSNGVVRRDGACVMGRGIALQAKTHFPGLEYWLGTKILESGNHVHDIMREHTDGRPWHLVSFPVKHKWQDPADLRLIVRSCEELMTMIEEKKWSRVYLPKPGCGNGQLHYGDVRPAIKAVLDDRVTVIDL